MKDLLTQEELLFIKEGIDLYKRFSIKMLKAVVFSVVALILLMLVSEFPLNIILLTALGVIVISVCIWYSVFGRPTIKLKKDFINGLKIIQQVVVQKVKTRKGERNYVLSNGLKITDKEVEGVALKSNFIEKGQKLTITYTPFQKMIIHVKLNDEYSSPL